VRALLNTDRVPLIFGVTSNVASTDLAKYPWITTPTSAPEAKGWAAKVAELHPNGVKVGVIYADDSTGNGYLAQVMKALSGTKSKVVSTQSIQDGDSSAAASQVPTLKASGAQVLMAAPTGGGCITLLEQVASTGWKPTIFRLSCLIRGFAVVAAGGPGALFALIRAGWGCWPR
jgi:ABC-type branched-subunit amino acid transport system substrate-binding protein